MHPFLRCLAGLWLSLCALAWHTDANAQTEFEINPAMSASWFNPAESGHGITLDLINNGQAWVCWFTFRLNGERDWICGVGVVDGDTITFDDAFQVEGGAFPPLFDPDLIAVASWGSITITFFDCNNGHMTWTTSADGFQSGDMPLQRITVLDGLDCQSFIKAAPVTIPNTGNSVTLDGEQGNAEWAGAVEVLIEVQPDWVIPVLLQTDGTMIYAAFTNIAGPGRVNDVPAATPDTVFPELFFDVSPDDPNWDLDSHWLHTSFQDCYDRGTWKTVRQCANFGGAWDGTNWPLRPDQTVVEMQLHVGQIGLSANQPAEFLMFATVTSSLLGNQNYFSWPASAVASMPDTWQRMKLAE